MISKQPVRPSVESVDRRDRTRLTHQPKQKYEVSETNIGLFFALLIYHILAYCRLRSSAL